jgi:hypothetical protein
MSGYNSSVRRLVLLLPVAMIMVAAQPSAQITCSSHQECRDLALAAQQRGDVEAFHDLAWRTVQTGPRNDATLMFLLARAQSISGRASDALVMLKRLADRGVDITEAETSDDFRRVRNLAAWADWKGVPPPAPAAASTPPAATAAVAEASMKTAPSTAAAVIPPAAAPASAPSPATPSKPAPSVAKPDTPATFKGGAAAAAPAATATPDAKAAAAGERIPALALPIAVSAPSALAYDGVSGRLVLVDQATETLKVLSELSGNAVNLVSRGWGGPYRTTGIAIDPVRGDLWAVAAALDAAAPAPSVIHRLQLVSGRLLYSVPAPADEPASRLVAIAHTGNMVYALDAAGSRLFELAPGAKTLRARATMKIEDPTSLAVDGDGIAYVSHRAGISRVTLANGRNTALSVARNVNLEGIVWLARYRDALLAIQRTDDNSHVAVRIRLDASGRRATRVDVLGDAAAAAATVMDDVLYFVAPSASGGTAIERVKLK